MTQKTTAAVLFLLLALLPPVPARAEAKPANVVVAEASTMMSAETAKMNGIVYFENKSLVSAEVSGKARQIFFEEGNTVTRGQKLLTTDTILLEEELAWQKIKLEALEVKIERTRKDLERYEMLYKSRAASESAYDDLKFSYKGLLKEKAALQKQIETTEIKIDKSSVYSPFTGLVIEKRVEKGNWVTPGDPVARIGAADSVSVKVPVSENFVRFSKKGDDIPLVLTALDKSLTGKIAGFKPYADARTKNLYLEIRIEFDGFVAENMSAEVDVPTGPEIQVLTVPRDALVSSGGSQIVYTVEENKAVPVPVKILGYSGIHAKVDSETLADGMPVIVDGNERLRPEQSVNIVADK